MSDIESLLRPIETRIERLEGDHGSKFAEPMDAQLAAWEQVRATLLSANEAYRIANALERIADIFAGVSSIVNDVETGEAWKVLAIADVSRGKTAVKNPN